MAIVGESKVGNGDPLWLRFAGVNADIHSVDVNIGHLTVHAAFLRSREFDADVVSPAEDVLHNFPVGPLENKGFRIGGSEVNDLLVLRSYSLTMNWACEPSTEPGPAHKVTCAGSTTTSFILLRPLAVYSKRQVFCGVPLKRKQLRLVILCVVDLL